MTEKQDKIEVLGCTLKIQSGIKEVKTLNKIRSLAALLGTYLDFVPEAREGVLQTLMDGHKYSIEYDDKSLNKRIIMTSYGESNGKKDIDIIK